MNGRLFCNISQAAQLIGRSRDVVREAMVDTERAGIRPAWVRCGRSVDFEIADIARWWREVNEWRATVDSQAASGKSDGATPTVRRAAKHGPRQRRETNSLSRSASAKTAESATSPNARALLLLQSGTV